MGNGVIVAGLVLVIVYAVKNSMKHFRGEGGCCGGGGDSPVTKKDIPVKKLAGEKLGEKRVAISGMHCERCVFSVTRAIDRIEGASARVSLREKQAVISYDREISDDAIRRAVESQGFTVTDIQG